MHTFDNVDQLLSLDECCRELKMARLVFIRGVVFGDIPLPQRWGDVLLWQKCDIDYIAGKRVFDPNGWIKPGDVVFTEDGEMTGAQLLAMIDGGPFTVQRVHELIDQQSADDWQHDWEPEDDR